MSQLKDTLAHVKQKCRNKAFELKQLENYRDELIRQKQTSGRAHRRQVAATKRYKNAKQKSALLISDSEDDTSGELLHQSGAADRGKKKVIDVAGTLDVEEVRAPMPGTDGVKDTVRRMPLPGEDEDELDKFLLGIIFCQNRKWHLFWHPFFSYCAQHTQVMRAAPVVMVT